MSDQPLIKIVNGKKHYLKLTKNQRVQHFILMTTFIFCVLTGIPLKYYYYPWAKSIMDFFGGVIATGYVHRVSGVIMVAGFIYHLFYVTQQLNKYYVRPAKAAKDYSIKGLLTYLYYAPVFPRYKDWKDMKDMFKYYLFLTDKHPQHERFYWREKLDYLAVFWGTNVLGITGLILWKKGFFLQFFPGWGMNVFTIAHSFEALLATADIIVWHMYNAHVNYDKFPASDLFLSGYLPEAIMKHEYVLEWKRINDIVRDDPSKIFDNDKWEADREAREIEQYKATKHYIKEMSEAADRPYYTGGEHHDGH
jgi:cytochrome b subunit of formate dehydrogenase